MCSIFEIALNAREMFPECQWCMGKCILCHLCCTHHAMRGIAVAVAVFLLEHEGGLKIAH